jgi:outer membrane receptor protein involved in Fe transport
MACNSQARRSILATLVALAAVWTLAPADVAAQGVGAVQGVIRNEETKETLDYANVVLTRTSDGSVAGGSMSLSGGRFYLRGIPEGNYVLKVLYLGYKPVNEEVRIVAGETLDLSFDLVVTVVKQFDVFDVSGETIMVEVKDTETSHSIGSEKLTDYAVDTVEEAVARQAGVVQRNGELHVRGGRSGEISFRIDGIAVDDPLGGGALSVGSFSVQNVTTVTGGQDPEYGNALSGVVNIETKEGNPEKFEMQARFMTDDFGRQDRTFTNFDRFEVGFGGPTFSKKLTYYMSGDFRFTDNENFNGATREEHELNALGVTLAKWRRRQFNDVKGSTKLAYNIDPKRKLTAEYTLSYNRSEPYLPNWDVQGYARQLVVLPQVVQPSGGTEFELTGRSVTVFYGDWVEQMESLSVPSLVRSATGGRLETLPILTVRDIRGAERTVVARPTFQGFRQDQSTYFTEKAADDTSLVGFNAANRGPQNDRFSNQAKLVWKHTLNDDTFYYLRFARVEFSTLATVGLDRKLPQEFVHGGIDSPDIFGSSRREYRTSSDFYTDPLQPIFVTEGDFPFYQDQNSITYSTKFDLTSNRYEGHQMKGGIQIFYNDLRDELYANPAREVENRFTGEFQTGGGRNIFNNNNPEGSFYLQDRWEYEGMVINGGFRWDMFSPGNSSQITVDNEDIDANVAKYKHQFSPRLGFAFPITDRDAFNFHYGRFVQFPSRAALFASQSSIGNTGILGNPDLEAETTISYQAGILHQFNDYMAMQFAVYNKDIYGLISATQVTDDATGSTVARSINRAYGNGRGVELTLERRFHNRWAFEIAYSYAFADGVASSQQFGANPDGLKFLPNQELPLDWDQRHTVALDLRIQEPNSWAASLSFDYGSGFPWTPAFRFERRQDPLLENSNRLPADYNLRLQAERHVNLLGQKLILLFQGLNLLNQDQVTAPNLGLFPGPTDATPAYLPYLTETGKFGGAYLQDIDGDNNNDFVPINDPRVFGQHRLFRVGVSWEF